MKELLEYLARALVEKPEQVEMRQTPFEGGTLYELKVAPEDIGKVIGRDGRTVNAIRALLASMAQRKGERVRLEVADDRRDHGAVDAAGASPEPV